MDTPNDQIERLPITSSKQLSPLYEAFTDEDDENGDPIFSFSSFGYITDDYVVYFGQSNSRTRHLTGTEIKKSLQLLPDDEVYPQIPSSNMTVFSSGLDDKLYVKGPKLNTVFLGTKILPKLILQEAETMELLSRNPHPNIINYHGCLTRRGLIVGLVLDCYDLTLKQKLDEKMLPHMNVKDFMYQIRSAISHLHSLGLAHNDLTPMNIMVDANDEKLVLIDFGSCRPFGSSLITAGTWGWTDEDYCHSAKEHDLSALEKLSTWLERMQEEGKVTSSQLS